MTREELLDMARFAECEETWGADSFRFTVEELEVFARLVAAAEREACAKVCDEMWEKVDCAEGDHPFGPEYAVAIRARGEV